MVRGWVTLSLDLSKLNYYLDQQLSQTRIVGMREHDKSEYNLRLYKQRTATELSSNNRISSDNRSLNFQNTNAAKSPRASSSSRVERLSEYLLELTLLIFELQNFSASMVASAWILWAKHILKLNPIWSKDLEELTGYSYESLIKWSNIILSNYNNVKIGNVVLPVQQSFGLHIVSYEHVPLQEVKEYSKDLSSASLNAANNVEKTDWSEYSQTHHSIQNMKQNNSVIENCNSKSPRNQISIQVDSKESTNRLQRSIYNGITDVRATFGFFIYC